MDAPRRSSPRDGSFLKVRAGERALAIPGHAVHTVFEAIEWQGEPPLVLAQIADLPAPAAPRRVLAIETRRGLIGLGVDEVLGFVRFAPEHVLPLPEHVRRAAPSFQALIAEAGETGLLVVDPDALTSASSPKGASTS